MKQLLMYLYIFRFDYESISLLWSYTPNFVESEQLLTSWQMYFIDFTWLQSSTLIYVLNFRNYTSANGTISPFMISFELTSDRPVVCLTPFSGDPISKTDNHPLLWVVLCSITWGIFSTNGIPQTIRRRIKNSTWTLQYLCFHNYKE